MINYSIADSTCGIDSDIITPACPNYKLGSWPPADDFPVVIDSRGNVVSRFLDPIWRLWPWANKTLNISFLDTSNGGRSPAISKENSYTLRLIAAWLLYGPAAVNCTASFDRKMTLLKSIFKIATAENIDITQMSKFPRVIQSCARDIPPKFAAPLIHLLHQLLNDAEAIGFSIIDEAGLRSFASLVSSTTASQTAYIPPRIWKYQFNRVEEFIEDFLLHKHALIKCFNFCLATYAEFYGSLERACTSGVTGDKYKSPFSLINRKTHGGYPGGFADVALTYGILNLLNKWVVPDGKDISSAAMKVTRFSTYLSMANAACLSHILNLSLMRISEAWSLTIDCLEIEKDPDIGDIYLLKGITTKTVDDDEARWIAAPSVSKSVEVARCVADLRNIYEKRNAGIKESGSNDSKRFLFVRTQEPWAGIKEQIRGIRHIPPSYKQISVYFPKLLEPKELKITKRDMEMARLITPTLDTNKICEGKIWPLAWHQLRRTGAVNMQASGLVSDSSIQYQLKHVTRAMTLYYGRGYSHLRLSHSSRNEFIKTMYEVLAKEIELLQSDRFVSPYGQQRKDQILHLVSISDSKKLVSATKAGKISWRFTVLGGCTKKGYCEYGGIDNVARCCGGDGRPPCIEGLIDKSKKNVIFDLGIIVNERIESAPEDSPYKTALMAQKASIDNALRLLDSQEESAS